MKEVWKPYPMYCPNCGRLNYGNKSEDNRIKYECVQCTVKFVRVQKGRRHDLAFNGKVCSSVEYSDEQRFLEDLKESLYHGEPLCVVLYRDQNGKTISRAFLNDLDTLPKGLFVEDRSRRKPQTVSPKRKEHEPER